METRIFKPDDNGLSQCAGIIRAGGLVAFPTETVYGLGANALDGAACAGIFTAKGRPSDNPLIVHVSSPDMARTVCHVSDSAAMAMERFWPGPLSLVLKKRPVIPDRVSGGLDTVAVRMPDNDVALALVKRAGVPIAAPSANRSGSPSPTTAAHVLHDLAGRIDAVLDGGDCSVGVESTVVDMTGGHAVILRPGAVTPEMLRGVDPRVSLHPGLKEGDKPSSPGMKYAHYAPKAELTLVCGKKSAVSKKILDLATKDLQNNRKPVILCLYGDVYQYAGIDTIALGEDINTVARSLYSALRAIDEGGYDSAYCGGFDERGVGLAVMNRLKKACAGRIICCKEDPSKK